MSKVSRSVLISELDALTNGTLSTMVSNLEFCTNSYNHQSIRKKKRDRVKDEDVLYIRRNKLRPCEALRYLHSKGYTVTNKCARLIVNGTSHKKII